MSFNVADNEAFQPFLIGRRYEAISDRRWPVCIEGIAIDVGGVCASIQDFLGPHLERYNYVIACYSLCLRRHDKNWSIFFEGRPLVAPTSMPRSINNT